MIKTFVLTFTLLIIIQNAVPTDKMKVPGYDDSFEPAVYAGYLNTSSANRKLHYVFIESANKANNSDPVTLWLNGGPGCSSLLGFLQQIGPYYLQQGIDYKKGDKLTPNPHSWHKLSNLLFLQSPPGVGYSINKDTQYHYNDLNTLNDNFEALLSFFKSYPEYVNNPFWIAGQSYAGKYIPDLAVMIDYYNQRTGVTKVNMKGFLIGNGVMNFQNDELQKSEIQFTIDHQFVDPQLISYYSRACMNDEQSAGCIYFKTRFDATTEQINPYSVYDYCYYNDTTSLNSQKKKFHSQQGILKMLARQSKFNSEKSYGAPCAYFKGMYDYFNAHVQDYHGQSGMTWNGPCAQNISQKYNIDQSGSMNQWKHLMGQSGKYHMVLYNGDWDAVVPYTDTLKNLQKLNIQQSYVYTPWFVDEQHAGFIQLYAGLTFILVKGASHQVPQSKRAESYSMFQSILKSHGSQQKFKQIILKK